MWSEKRNIEGCMFLARIPIIIGLAIGIVYFLKGGSLESVNGINGFSGFGVAVCSIFNFFIKGQKISTEKKIEIKNKMTIFKTLGLIFVGYFIFTIFIVKKEPLIITALIMCVAYANIYILKYKSKSINTLTDAQKNWREVYNMDSQEESNFWWRIKPMLNPHVSVELGKRIKAINWFVLVWILVMWKGLSFSVNSAPFLVLIMIFCIPDIIYFIDAIFGLYTETEGICTGVVRHERSENSRRVYYEVYVTDFSNKREIKFKVYDNCYYKDGDNIKVVHGSLSKKVIESKRYSNIR